MDIQINNEEILQYYKYQIIKSKETITYYKNRLKFCHTFYIFIICSLITMIIGFSC